MGAGVAVVGNFIASDCQANAMCFILGHIDVADEVGVGIFNFGNGLFGYKKYYVDAFNAFGGETVFTSTPFQAENLLPVEISQVVFLGPERIVWKEDLAPALVLITAEAVATMGRGYWWRVFLVGY